MFDMIVVSLVLLAAIAFLVVRFARKGAGCAELPAWVRVFREECERRNWRQTGEVIFFDPLMIMTFFFI